MAWYNESWIYRKAIVIAHTDDGAQTNYQMKLLVGESSGATGEEVDCGGLCLSNFNDLRFTTSDGTTLCPYWIESISGATPNQLATVWINVPSIAAHPDDTTIYMYYGNASASAASSGADTFPFFDDFSGDLTKWAGNTAAAAIASGAMTLTRSGSDVYLYGDTTVANNVRMRTRAKVNDIDYSIVGMGSADTSWYPHVRVDHNSAAANHSSWDTVSDAGATTIFDTTLIDFNVYHVYDLCRLLTGTDTVRIFCDGVQRGSDCTTNVGTPAYTAKFSIQTNNGTVIVDYVFLSNYTYNEPTWGSFGSQEKIEIVTLNVLAEAVAAGIAPSEVFAGELVTLNVLAEATATGIVPSWAGEWALPHTLKLKETNNRVLNLMESNNRTLELKESNHRRLVLVEK